MLYAILKVSINMRLIDGAKSNRRMLVLSCEYVILLFCVAKLYQNAQPLFLADVCQTDNHHIVMRFVPN